jgi:hypothetical protein
MDQRPPNMSEVLTFPSKLPPRDERDLIDQAGPALVAILREAGNVANENVDRAKAVADKLWIRLRAAEDRIAQLQVEAESLRSRALRAEWRLETIKNELQHKVIAPIEAGQLLAEEALSKPEV